MSVTLGRYSDGHSPYPLTVVTPKERALIPFCPHSLLSNLSRCAVASVTGNASIQEAQVICLSDFHYDPLQKHVRSHLINEILRIKGHGSQPIIILLEGAQSCRKPASWVYERLVAGDSLHQDHLVAGWDHMRLNRLSLQLIANYQALRSHQQELKARYCALQSEKSKLLHNSQQPINQTFEEIDHIDDEQQALLSESQKISKAIEAIFERLNQLSDERTKSLYDTLHQMVQSYPDSLIFVIGGGLHFQRLYQHINDVAHIVLEIRNFRAVSDFDAAVDEVYGCAIPEQPVTSSILIEQLA